MTTVPSLASSSPLKMSLAFMFRCARSRLKPGLVSIYTLAACTFKKMWEESWEKRQYMGCCAFWWQIAFMTGKFIFEPQSIAECVFGYRDASIYSRWVRAGLNVLPSPQLS